MPILLIDDDVELCELLLAFLQREGFDVETMHRFEPQAWDAIRERIELVVLDVGLPGLNGFEVLRLLRDDSRVPVLMLTARGDDIDRIVGLELGADDYLPKPCNPRELSARIRAILRRVDGGASQRGATLVISGVVLDPATRSVDRGDERLELTSTEFNVLERLMRDAGQIVTKDALMRDALGRRLRPFDRAIDMHISSIRRKLGDDLVRTVRGLGYQFVRR
jgi:two-component system, OmpR family, response regulator CpxR